MLTLYESQQGVSRKVAEIPFDEMLAHFGVRRFFRIQELLGRMVVFVSQDLLDSTLRADGGRVEKHHSMTAPEPNQKASVSGEESKVHPSSEKASLAGWPLGGRAKEA